MLYRKWLRSAGKSFPVLKVIFQHGIGISWPGNNFPALQNLFLHWKSFSNTASALPGQQTRLPCRQMVTATLKLRPAALKLHFSPAPQAPGFANH
ncbi:MAG TPA: hypothetical protein VLL56_10425 [Terriglobia bacterium]|nr:hypothetical protein [Terriglobia bacterium]